jgi:hypothetical protein
MMQKIAQALQRRYEELSGDVHKRIIRKLRDIARSSASILPGIVSLLPAALEPAALNAAPYCSGYQNCAALKIA